jgi:hypothetical protein
MEETMIPDDVALARLRDHAPIASAWLHKKSGGVCLVLGYGRIEATARPAIIYGHRDGDVNMPWVRDAEEFFDGRFERVALCADGSVIPVGGSTKLERASQSWKEVEQQAADRVRGIMEHLMPESRDDIGASDFFNPWDIFPSLYGSYSSDFDDCAIDVLRELLDRSLSRDDLSAQMLREMLCQDSLCDYGTSPRVCFPTEAFKPLIPDLIRKWQAYYVVKWGG